MYCSSSFYQPGLPRQWMRSYSKLVAVFGIVVSSPELSPGNEWLDPLSPARLITRYANAPAGSTGQHTHSRRQYMPLVISSLYLYFHIIFFYIEIWTTYCNNKHPLLLFLYHIFMSLILLHIQYIVSKYPVDRVICNYIDCVIERTSRCRWDFGNVTIFHLIYLNNLLLININNIISLHDPFL